MSGSQTPAPTPTPTPTLPAPEFYFTLGADGQPKFYNSLFSTVPAGATPISFTAYRLWLDNPNLLPLALTLASGATVWFTISPHTKPSTDDFWLIATAAERVLMTIARRTNVAIDLGLTHAGFLGYVNLLDAETQQWFAANLAAQTISQDRLAYMLAGVPPTAAQIAASAATLAAMPA